MAKGILIASMNMANAAEDEFHDWYDTEHLPERVACPGFLRCQRLLLREHRWRHPCLRPRFHQSARPGLRLLQ